jgi:hypothetical protein
MVLKHICKGAKDGPRPVVNSWIRYNNQEVRFERDGDFNDYDLSWEDSFPLLGGTVMMIEIDMLNEWARSTEQNTVISFEPI